MAALAPSCLAAAWRLPEPLPAADSMVSAKSVLQKAYTTIRVGSYFYVFYNYVGFISQVDGPSMFPTFTGRGDWVVVEALPGVADRVQVGDVIICQRPIQAGENVIKRVAALEGQSVPLFRPGQLAPAVVQVPRGHVWLTGDNLILSRDSREYGPVPLALMRGRVVAQLWPSLKWVERKVV